MGLQITSMADIFTIILVFLLKSFATGLTTVSPPSGMTLPSITTESKKQLKDTVKLEVLAGSVVLDNKPILQMNGYSIPNLSRDPASGQPVESPVNQVIFQALMLERQKHKDTQGQSDIIVMADEKTPYSTLKIVMNSAASAGYVDMQLVVIGAQ